MGDRYQHDCPQPEDLSAWFDSELCDAHLEMHIAECAACQSRLRDYALLDRVFAEELVCDEATSERIKSSCLAGLFSGGKLIFYPLWWRSATAAAALLTLSFLVIMQARNQRPTMPNQNVHHLMAEFSAEAPVPSASLARTADEPTPRPETAPVAIVAETPAAVRPERASLARDVAAADKSTPIELNNLVYVSQGSDAPSPRMASAPGPRAAGASQVADYVRHVWLVKDTAAPIAELQRLLPKNHDVLAKLAAEKRSEVVLQLQISDRDLQTLVLRFDKLGFTLLSPDLPQPDGDRTLNFRDQPVQYELDFVTAD